jgi:hypothetical protein
MDKNFGDLFNEAVQALLDAMSYIDEFDGNTFMSSVVSSFHSSRENVFPEDDWSKSAGRQAKNFLEHANSLISILMKFHPKNVSETRYSDWHDELSYKRAVGLVDLLQKTVIVIPKLKQTADTISGISFSTARQGLLSFKKQCEAAIQGLNNIINTYNRYVDDLHKLNPIRLSK